MQKNITWSLLVVGVIIFGGSGCGGYNRTVNDRRDDIPPAPVVLPVPSAEPTVVNAPSESDPVQALESAPAPAKAPVSVTEEKPPARFSSVNIQNFAFSPASVTVKKGTIVTWTNNDSVAHKVKSGSFNSDLLENGQSYSHVFNEVGTFDYICAPHPSMKAKIIVE